MGVTPMGGTPAGMCASCSGSVLLKSIALAIVDTAVNELSSF
jgi:streptogramin lyase